MRRVTYARRALRDLAAVRTYISRDNPMAADRVFFDLLAACEGLRHFPRRGRPGKKRGTRELTTVWPYVIVYEIERDGTVVIEAFYHGAQNR